MGVGVGNNAGFLGRCDTPGSFTQATGDDFYLSAFPEVVVDDTGDAAYTSGDDTGSGNGVYHVDETGFLRVTDRYGTGYAPFVDGTFLGGDDGSFTVVPFVIEVGSGGGTTLPPLPSSVVEAVEFIISRDVSLKFAGPMAAGEGTVNYTLKVTNEDDFAPTDAKVEFFAKDETDMGSRGVFFASSVDVDPTARTGTWECHTGRLGPHTLACTVFGLGPGDSAVLDFTATSGFTTTVEVDDFSFELVETGRFPLRIFLEGTAQPTVGEEVVVDRNPQDNKDTHETTISEPITFVPGSNLQQEPGNGANRLTFTFDNESTMGPGTMDGDLSNAERQRVLEMANYSPVHLMVKQANTINTKLA